MNGYSQDEIIKRACQIVTYSRERDVTLRMVGGCAIHEHCPSLSNIHTNVLGRKFRDTDFIGLSDQIKDIIRMFGDFGYAFDKYRSAFSESSLVLFAENEHVDIFLDKLIFNHTIDLRNRLGIDFPTISLADLLLQKLQIVKVNEKDLHDILILLAEHDIGASDKETINSEYLSDLLCSDWGFYATCTANLVKLKDVFLERFPISNEIRSNAREKIDALLQNLDSHSKSLSWKLRARVGTSAKWYADVEEHTR